MTATLPLPPEICDCGGRMFKMRAMVKGRAALLCTSDGRIQDRSGTIGFDPLGDWVECADCRKRYALPEGWPK